MEAQTRKVNVKIAEKDYTFSAVSPDQEEMIRRAADILNRRITAIQTQSPGSTLVKILTIIALNEINSGLRLQAQLGSVQKEASSLAAALDTYLEKTED